MPDTYTSQFSGEEIDAALRAAQMISGASTPAELRNKLEIRGDTIPVSAEDSTLISEALTKIPTTSGGGVNPNLLDNWYFGRPVNQRGQTEYTGNVYYIDRWRLWDGDSASLSVVSGGIKIAGTLYQYFEPVVYEELWGKTITISLLLADGTLYTDSFSLKKSEWYTVRINAHGLNAIQFGINNNDFGNQNNNFLRVSPATVGTLSDTILAAKIELGDTQTLAHKENGVWVLNEIPDFGEQLRRCMYYAEKVESKDTPAITNSTFVPPGATSAVFILPYARKRTVPAINFNDVSNYRIIARSISGETTAFSVTAISPLDVGRTKAAILVSFNATDQDYYCFLQRADNAPAGYAFVSADL